MISAHVLCEADCMFCDFRLPQQCK